MKGFCYLTIDINVKTHNYYDETNNFVQLLPGLSTGTEVAVGCIPADYNWAGRCSPGHILVEVVAVAHRILLGCTLVVEGVERKQELRQSLLGRIHRAAGHSFDHSHQYPHPGRILLGHRKVVAAVKEEEVGRW